MSLLQRPNWVHHRYVPPPLPTNRHHCPLEHGPGLIRCDVSCTKDYMVLPLSKLYSKRRHNAEGSFQRIHRQQGGTKKPVNFNNYSTAHLCRERSKVARVSEGEDEEDRREGPATARTCGGPGAGGAIGAAGPSERDGKPFLPHLPLTLELQRRS